MFRHKCRFDTGFRKVAKKGFKVSSRPYSWEGVMHKKRFAKIFPRNDKLRKIIQEHGEFFEVIGAAEIQPALKNQLCLTLKDENITFTTSVTNLRIVQD